MNCYRSFASYLTTVVRRNRNMTDTRLIIELLLYILLIFFLYYSLIQHQQIKISNLVHRKIPSASHFRDFSNDDTVFNNKQNSYALTWIHWMKNLFKIDDEPVHQLL